MASFVFGYRIVAAVAALAFPFASASLTAQTAPHHTWYVATDGNDNNPGTVAAPYRTITKGAAKLHAGDTLYVRAGVYHEEVVVTASGEASAPILIAAYPGESPVIDGHGLPASEWAALVRLDGSYIKMDGFEVRYAPMPHGEGVVLGDHDTVSRMNVHHIPEAGILARGDYSVVEYSRAWQNAYRNCRAKDCPTSPYPNGGWATGISAAREATTGITHHAVLRHNLVYNNWGEGLSTFEANGTVMEDNVVYDNWATNTYISDASNVVFQRNLIYTTAESVVGLRMPCVTLADEVPAKPRSTNNVVINNMCLNGDLVAFAWTLVPGSGLVNALIADNTIVNGTLRTGPLATNSAIVNNIFAEGKPAEISTRVGLKMAHNLWTQPPPANAQGTDDVVGDPELRQTGAAGPGQLLPAYFSLDPQSPAAHGGVSLGGVVATDAFGTARKPVPTIGAYEIPGP